MTRAGRTVVPFERPAAYWATRARQHYARRGQSPARMPDAARLMRKALEKSGDPAMALELARIYMGMGCFTAAERYLIRASARGGLTGGVCFSIGCCALNRGDEDLADDALEMSLRLDPDGPDAESAQELLEMRTYFPPQAAPRSARGQTLCRFSRRAFAAGNQAEALRLAKRAWEKAPLPQTALWLGTLLPLSEALPYFAFAARHMPGEQEPRLLLALSCHQVGFQADARRHLLLAKAMCRGVSQAEAYCAAAWEMDQPEAALALAAESLEKYPASVDYLRLKYLSLRRMGEEAQARRALETLLEIDPDDAAGLWYRRHPEDIRPYGGRRVLLSALGHQVRTVPRRLAEGPLNRILHLMVVTLADTLEAADIYRLLPPLWRRLSPAERAACDGRKNPRYPVAFALYLLLMAGRSGPAVELYRAAPGKRRLLRALRRFAQRMRKE